MGRKWLHPKKFDPQLAFKCLKSCGVIRALQFICNEDKQVPAVKFIPGSGLRVFILHNFSEVLFQILFLFFPFPSLAKMKCLSLDSGSVRKLERTG